jgi:hypothetical protein
MKMRIFSVAILAAIFVATVFPRNPQKLKPKAVTYGFAKHALQGFNFQIWLSNQLTMGQQAWDGMIPPTPGCLVGISASYPAGSCNEHLYGAAPWVGGIINGVRFVDEGYNGDDANMEFATQPADTLRDRIWQTTIYDTLLDPNRPGYYKMAMNRKRYDDDHDGKIDEDELDGLDNDGDWDPAKDDIGADGIPDTMEVGCKGPYDPITNPDPAYDNYAPTKYDSCHPLPNGQYRLMNDPNLYTEHNGIPDHGEPHVDEDYGAESENDLYLSATDTSVAVATAIPNYIAKYIKIFQKSYAWSYGSVNAILPFDYYVVNVGQYTIDSVYFAFFADMDIGPVSVAGYYQHNRAMYDPQTMTAYIDNPIDRGSTPMGITLTSIPPTDGPLRTIFQWWDFTTRVGPGPVGNDSLAYEWISGDAWGPSGYIWPNQAANQLSDTRVLISVGPFPTMHPGDTLRVSLAFVAGMDDADMLNNASRVHRLVNSGGIVMPNVHVTDAGGTTPVKFSWDPIIRSPYGRIAAYRVYYGTSTGVYTDSVTTDSLSISIPRTTAGSQYFATVRMIDDEGNLSALSDEYTNVPNKPALPSVVDGPISITVEWTPNVEVGLAGYNLYRSSTQDSVFVKLNSSLLTQTIYTDTAVWGNQGYTYRVTAVDVNGHESIPSDTISGRLLPPAAPANFVVGRGTTYLHPGWTPNTEGNLLGYNIYRATAGTPYVRLNNSILKRTDYRDSTVMADTTYYYAVEAVDTLQAVSPQSTGHGATIVRDIPVLALNIEYPYPVTTDSTDLFYQYLLRNYSATVTNYETFYGAQLYDYDRASILLCLSHTTGLNVPSGEYNQLRDYLLGGGNLVIVGNHLLTSAFGPPWYPFLSEIFGVDYLTYVDSSWSFIGATGSQGFPSVNIDPTKLTGSASGLNYVERFPAVPNNRVIYTFRANSLDSAAGGQPVGIMSQDPMYNAYYLSFPLYSLDTASAQALIDKLVATLSGVTGVKSKTQVIPKSFRLYQAYPNPFNPTTTIRFDLPAAAYVTLDIFDVLGRMVAQPLNARRTAGTYEIEWNATGFPSGVYFYRIRAGNYTDVKKVLLMK